MNLCFCPSREICFELLILILIPEIIISTPDPWTVDSTSDYIVESSGDIKKKKKKKKAENEEQKHTSPSIGVITLTMKWTLCPKQGQDCQRSKIHSVRSILESDKKNRLKVEGWEKIHRADSNHKRSRVAILMSGEKEVKTNRKSNNKKARILEGRIINTRS